MRRLRVLLALIVTPALLAGCVGLPLASGSSPSGRSSASQTAQASRKSVTVHPMYTTGNTGGVADEVIELMPSDGDGLRIDFSENEVSGFGDMTRAATWNAVTVATLLTGAPLDRRYRFAFSGAIDGPSAGALTTVGVLSLLRGDALRKRVTMTGTINPTGTIGTVGGIPEKIQGVIDKGTFDTVLIPAGQRNATDHAGHRVDVVDLGASKHVTVVEVGTIYDAYQRMTGVELPAPHAASDPRLTEAGYDKLSAATDEALARYDRAASEFSGLTPRIRAAAKASFADAHTAAAKARDLKVQGLPAGAFVEAHRAALLMEAVFGTFDTLQAALVSGPKALTPKLQAASTGIDEFNAHVDSLSTYHPKTLNDVEALVDSYGNAFDAFSLLSYGVTALQQVSRDASAGRIRTPNALVNRSLLPLLFLNLGRSQLEFAKALFDVGRDNGGAPVKGADPAAVGAFLRHGADANWAAFESGVLATNADAAGQSVDAFRARLSSVDLNVALAHSAQIGQQTLEKYLGEDAPNAAYAAMGYGALNYARNALLLEKYYNNGILGKDLTIVGVRSDAILSTALELGRRQLAGALDVLDSHSTPTVITVGAFEQAAVDREGNVAAKFDAIAQYSTAFIVARAMAYLGGFPAAGWGA